MRIRINSPRHRRIIIFIAMPSAILPVAIFFILNVVALSMSPEDAEKRIRLLLQRELSQQHLAVLKQKGARLPDVETAKQWQKEIGRINSLEFVSVEVNIILPDLLLAPFMPTYVVKAVIRDGKRPAGTRYFWLSWSRTDRETSKVVWFFSL